MNSRTRSSPPPLPGRPKVSLAPGAFWTSACFLAAYLLFLGKNRLLGLDEGWYALMALSAVRDGHWFPLFFEGHPFWDKPPLIPWLQGLSFLLLGPSEIAVRIWSPLAAAGVLYFTHRTGSLLGRSPWAGFLCAFLLGLQPHFILYARLGTLDMPLALCLAGMTWEVLRGWEASPVERDRAFLRSGLWLALAIWVKSWSGMVLIPSVLAVLLFSRSKEKEGAPWARFLLPGVLSAAAWLLLHGLTFGRPYLAWEFHQDLLGRSRLGGPLWGIGTDPKGWGFYADLFRQGLPLLWPLLPLGAALWAKGSPVQGPTGKAAAWLLGSFLLYYTFLLGGVMVPLINYLLPLLPPLVLLLTLGILGALGRFPLSCGLGALLGVVNGWAGLSAWPWVLVLSLLTGLGPFFERKAPPVGKTPVVLALGLLLAALPWKAGPYLLHPPDPNRVWVEAVQAHPAEAPGQVLYFEGEHTDARVLSFYSRYRVIPREDWPEGRPPGALLLQKDRRAVFLPAPGKP